MILLHNHMIVNHGIKEEVQKCSRVLAPQRVNEKKLHLPLDKSAKLFYAWFTFGCKACFMAPFSLNDKAGIVVAIPTNIIIIIAIIIRPGIAGAGGGP